MLKNKKILIIFILIFSLLLVFTSNSFASIDIVKDKVNYSFPDLPYKDRPYFILGTPESPELFQPYYSIEEFKSIYGLDNNYQYEYLIANNYTNNVTLHLAFVFCYKDNGEYKYYTTVHENRGWSNARYKIVNGKWQLDGRTGDVATRKENIFASSQNIYYERGLTGVTQNSTFNTSIDNAFFQKTPPQVTVVEIAQVEEIPKAIVGVMKTIIPVGLVVLSIFLIIYLIRLVILRQV